jgi:hydroxymethylpyrimidine/phosphomethylpyrimidine kinase
MLASAETIEVVADALRRHGVTTSVVDPVRPSRFFSRASLSQ